MEAVLPLCVRTSLNICRVCGYQLKLECQTRKCTEGKKLGGRDEGNLRTEGTPSSCHREEQEERERFVSWLKFLPDVSAIRILAGVFGKLPASRETYWITDNLGMDRASTEGCVQERGRRESDMGFFLNCPFSLLCFPFTLYVHLHCIPMKLNQ